MPPVKSARSAVTKTDFARLTRMAVEQEGATTKAQDKLLRRVGKLKGADIPTRLPAWALSNGLLMRISLAVRVVITP